MRYNYNLKVDRELTDQEQLIIKNLITENINIRMKPLSVVDWREALRDYAHNRLREGAPISYKDLGISYQQLGINYAARQAVMK